MALAHTAHAARWSSLCQHIKVTTLIPIIVGLLNACGGGDTELQATPGTGACITGPAPAVLNWDHVGGAAGYRIHYGTSIGSYPQSQDAGLNTTLTVTGLSSGQTYYFVATAYDSSFNESGFSNAVCKTIP
jgi:hypothetical protein